MTTMQLTAVSIAAAMGAAGLAWIAYALLWMDQEWIRIAGRDRALTAVIWMLAAVTGGGTFGLAAVSAAAAWQALT